MTPHPRRERRIRVASLLVAVGLLVEMLTLRSAHPTAFLIYAGVGGGFLGLGFLAFLSVLFATGPEA
jgi:hypothetical protein